MWGSFFFQYQNMETQELAIESANVLHLIKTELDIRRQQADLPLSEDQLKETSMLKPHEIIEGDRIYRDLKRHYQDKLREKGGVEGVIADLENYIIALLGNDEAYRTDEEHRKFNPNDPLSISQLKAALRAIKDNAPGSSFGSFLDPSSLSQIGATFSSGGGTSAREMLAYFWLAASDSEMELDAKDEPKREQCLHEEKMVVIASLYDIRRAHNDGVNTPVDDVKDDPSCGPGTWGRIAKMHVHNNKTKMHTFQNNATKYKDHLPAFVIDQFKVLSLDKQIEVINAMNNFFINGETPPGIAPFANFDSFILELQHDPAKGAIFLQLISEEYGESLQYSAEKILDENHQRYALLTYHTELRKMSKAINNDLFLRLQQIMIENLTSRSSELVKQQLENDSDVKLAKQRLNKIELEINTLQQQLESIGEKIKEIDFTKSGSTQQVDKLKSQKAELDKRFVALVDEKSSLYATIDSIARQQIALEMKKIFTNSTVLKSDEIEELFSAEALKKNPSPAVVQIATVSDESSGLPPEIAEIKPHTIAKHPSYEQIKRMYVSQKKPPEQAEQLTTERLLKAVIRSTKQQSQLSDERIDELVKQWVEHHGEATLIQRQEVDNPSVVKLQSVPVKMDQQEREIYSQVDALPQMEQIKYVQHQVRPNKNKNIKVPGIEIPVLVDFEQGIKRLNSIISNAQSEQIKGAAIEAKLAIGIFYFDSARSLREGGSVNKEMYDDYVMKAQACGINTSVHLDPKAIRQEGIDKAIINPAWLVRLKAKLEDLEESFRLNSAYVGKAINDTRYANMISQFNLFIEKSDLTALVSAEDALTKARDAYFKELEKESPLQSLLLKHYQEMQQAQNDVAKRIDTLIIAFSKQWKAKYRHFYDTDRAFLLDLVSNSEEVERSIIPALQEHFKVINERLAQLALLKLPHQLYQATETAVKRDTQTLVDGFYHNLLHHVTLLDGRKPTKGTIAAKQLKVLKQALSDLKVHVETLNGQIRASEFIGVPLVHFHQAAQAAVAIANSLQADATKIGQVSGIKKTTRNVKNGLRSAFGTVGFNVEAKTHKELTIQELASIQLDMDAQAINRQIFDVDHAREATKELATRQPAMSFEKRRREQQRAKVKLTPEQTKMALDYILLHTDTPEEVNLLGYLKPGVSVSVVDLRRDPLELQFEYISRKDAPKRIKMEVSQLIDFADRQKNKIAERENRQYATVYENYGILFRDYHAFGQVGTDVGRAERKEFVMKLNELINFDSSLLSLVLNAQQTKGLLSLSESLENANHLELLEHVQGVILNKASDFRGAQPVVSRDQWESTTAAFHQKELKDALVRLLELNLSSRQKI
ncbi:MAG: hypothetical protein AB7I18_09260 [Candidatus Berkiella sp.]